MKKLEWIGSSLDDLKDLPAEVQRKVGFSLREVQSGLTPTSAKPLSGFGGASVLEIVVDHDTNTFRAVYVVKFEVAVYVLHCFMKKSRSGISTPKQDLEKIRARLERARKEHEKWLREH